MKIEQILSHPIVGNAYSDGELLHKIHQFVLDENNTTEDKLKALHRLDQVMGVDTDYPTEKDLNEYLHGWG